MNQSLAYEFPQPIILAAQSGAMASLCSIGKLTGAVSALGQPDLTDFTPVPGLQNIQCILSVYRPASPDKASQMRGLEGFEYSNYRHVLLNGYFDGLITQPMQATVDGIAYEIMAVESDSQKTMTRLVVRLYTR